MQEPTWRDVLAYIAAALRNGDWPIVNWVALTLGLVLVRLIVSWAWARHREQQQLATLKSILDRWANRLGQPFWTLSTTRQLAGIEDLRGRLVGNRDMVLAVIVSARVQLEVIPVDESVLDALDRLAAEWQDKLSSTRRRQYRRLRELEKNATLSAARDPEA